ncbi:MAG: efflux RND transporter permease subunit [Deltaproteobacteria bacterium]|nr:efflux RND transporter permease subunit [Deltaproteobacteria bacterium]
MQWLAKISVQRPIFATVIMLMIAVIGVAGYFQLGVDRFPKVDFPTIAVTTVLPGAGPKEIETEVTEKIEEAVNTLGGIDELRSISSENVSMVLVTFVLEKNIDVAAQEVRDKVAAAIAQLPQGIETPVIRKFDANSTPILYLAVNAERPVREITETTDKVIRPQLENVSGVGQLSIVGGRKRQINVWVDPLQLRAHGLTAAEVQRAITFQNMTMPGGRLDSGPTQMTLRLRGRVGSPEEIGALVLREVDGHPVRVRDVARVEDGEEEAETVAIKDGAPAVVVAVRKQSGANTVAVVDAVRERLAEISGTLPPGYTLETVRDNSATIRTSVESVLEHLILGAIFAALVVLLFLGNLRSTVIAAIAIPISIIGTFALMWIEGFTLDTITLLALALAVGIVIDDAIVVLENIFRHVEEKGLEPFEAAVVATKEIGLAVLATTLSLVAVFLPVAFMKGVVGRFLNSFGLTMSFAIAVSMLVSFSLTPMLSSRWLKAHRPVGGGAQGRESRKPLLERIVDRAYLPIERRYVQVLSWVMHHRWVVVVASLVALIASGPLMMAVPKGFLPKSDEAQFEVNVRAPEGTSLGATELIGERLARQIRALDGVTNTLVTIGDDLAVTSNRARIYVLLSDPETRQETQEDLMNRVRRDIVAAAPENLKVDVSEAPMFEGSWSTAIIQYEISGPDLDKLTEYSARSVEALKKVPGAVDVDSTLVSGKPELGARIDREKAAALGVQVADIAATLRLLVGGDDVSTYEEHGKQYDVQLRAEPGYRADAASLALITVPAMGGRSVPLLDVVRFEGGEGPSSINRLNRRRQVLVTANVGPGYAESDVIGALGMIMKDLDMDAAYRSGPAGRSREMARTGRAFLLAFGLSFLFMYLVLAAQLESWLHPITILLALPLTLPFALVSLLIFGQQLDIYSMLGMLVLFGVVKKNSILQIDHTNQLRAKGLSRLEAILAANKERLRPILMTTLAFVAGMLPLVWSSGIGAGFNRATAGVIVGGQVLSLLLTLLATPVAYSLFDDLSAWLGRRIFARGEVRTAQDVI